MNEKNSKILKYVPKLLHFVSSRPTFPNALELILIDVSYKQFKIKMSQINYVCYFILLKQSSKD